MTAIFEHITEPDNYGDDVNYSEIVNRLQAFAHLDSGTSSTSGVSQNGISDNLKVVQKITHPAPNGHFKVIQKWAGKIVELHEEHFVAELTDLTQEGIQEIGDFDIAQIQNDDKDLLMEGAAFSWVIGTQTVRGTVFNSSFIRLRRLPKYTEKDKKRSYEVAEKMSAFFNS